MNRSILIIFLFASSTISGCLGGGEEPSDDMVVLPILEDPCLIPSSPTTQSLTSIEVDGVEREFRLSAPSSEPGTRLPLVIAFHGGTGGRRVPGSELGAESLNSLSTPLTSIEVND